MPHLLLTPPWSDAEITVPPATARHLRTVLRLGDGAPCSYTDGTGLRGSGTLTGDTVRRGSEVLEPEPPPVTLAVAPPAAKDRLRWLVEKSCEVGVSRIKWLRTAHGEGRPPRAEKGVAWAQMALEQSRRVFLARVDDGWSRIEDLTGTRVVLDPDGGSWEGISAPLTVMVGPEGGWAPEELPSSLPRVTLGDGVLRTETAAVLGVFMASGMLN